MKTTQIFILEIIRMISGLPAPTYITSSKLQEDTQITVLDSGIRVASEKRFGQFCTVGVAIDSGSR